MPIRAPLNALARYAGPPGRQRGSPSPLRIPLGLVPSGAWHQSPANSLISLKPYSGFVAIRTWHLTRQVIRETQRHVGHRSGVPLNLGPDNSFRLFPNEGILSRA